MGSRVAGDRALAYHPVASPSSHPLRWLTLDLVRLAPGETHSGATAGRELGIVVMDGTVDVEAGGRAFAGLGKRADVFGGRASALYAPPRTDFALRGASEGVAQVALCYSEAEEGGAITRIEPEDVVARNVGRSNWARRVEDVFAKAPASRLLVGETYNIPGGWSSYPPHKHDTDVPGREVVLEEIYHYRISPPQGFGVQCVYQAGEAEDQAFVIRDGDSVVIPGGYHPVVAAPGYSLYYLWVLAGPRRIMRPNDDPAHVWLKAVEAMLP